MSKADGERPNKAAGERPNKTEGAESTRRALQLLSLLGVPGPPKTLIQLATATGLAKSTAYRLLRVLQEEQYVERSNSGGYHFGSRFVSMAVSIVPEMELHSIINPVLQEIANETKETVTLHRRFGDQTILFFGTESEEHLLRFVVRIGDVRYITSGCRGRSILAFLDQHEQNRILSNESSAEKRTNLEDELKLIKNRGFVTAQSENLAGLNALGVPVFEQTGSSPVLSIVVSGPDSRWTLEKMLSYATKLMAASERLSGLLAKQSRGTALLKH